MTFCFAGGLRAAAAALLVCAFTVEAASFAVDSEPASLAGEKVAGAPDSSFDAFLDRLMRAESGGRELAANPRSTALGPFQFIKATFIYVTRRHFADEVAKLTEDQILALRTNRDFSRRAAAAYLKESAAFLAEQGLEPTFAHLRLAYLVGPYAAVRVMQASPSAPVSDVLAPGVLKANSFMNGMTAADLIARAARDVSKDDDGPDAAPQPRVRSVSAGPAPRVAPRPHARAAEKAKCNEKLPSCRHWNALGRQKPRVAEDRGPDKSQQRKKSKG